MRKLLLEKANQAKIACVTTALTVVPAMTALAAEGDTGISINFDTAQMFTFANTIIEALMPVVYITAGLGLGFMIINSLRSAFGSR